MKSILMEQAVDIGWFKQYWEAARTHLLDKKLNSFTSQVLRAIITCNQQNAKMQMLNTIQIELGRIKASLISQNDEWIGISVIETNY